MNIKEAIERNSSLVQVKDTEFNGKALKVVKYKKAVFYKNLWNADLEQFRGLILDENYNIVSYPFTKIYNFGVESQAPSFDDDERVIATRKINGFMVAITNFDGELLISTTGRVNSKFVDYAKDLLNDIIEKEVLNNPDYTFLFEAVHQEDPHIIPENIGLYFIGKRQKTLGSPIELCHDFSGATQAVQILNVTPFKVIRELAKEARHEGYVIYSLDRQRATKIKSKHYLISKAIARASADKLSRLNVDEEFFGLMAAIKQHQGFSELSEQERLEFIRSYFNENF
jgi:hypothetical protein